MVRRTKNLQLKFSLPFASRLKTNVSISLVLVCCVAAANSAVSAEEPNFTVNQGKPDAARLKIGNLPCDKLLILGNSITLHGPAPKIGWTGNWGMAASAKDKDFAHQLTNHMTKAAGAAPQVRIKNIADFERQLTEYKLSEELADELAFQADIIIVALGENAAPLKTDEDKARFQTAFTNLFARLKQHSKPSIFVRGQFWPAADKDQRMQLTCEAAGGTFIDISQLGTDESNYARAERKIEHAGVAAHPGDKGMLALADVIWAAIQKQAASK